MTKEQQLNAELTTAMQLVNSRIDEARKTIERLAFLMRKEENERRRYYENCADKDGHMTDEAYANAENRCVCARNRALFEAVKTTLDSAHWALMPVAELLTE